MACAFLTFTFCFFGPLELYLTNIHEFWFSILDILCIIIFAGVVFFLLLALVGVLLKGKPQDLFSCLIFGIALALYIQGNFINADYGVLDGTELNWDNTYYSILNTAIWAICIISPFVMLFINSKLLKSIFKFGSLFFISIQIVTLFFLLITTNLYKSNHYLSDEAVNTVSSQENIIVFVVDTFDQVYFEEILAKEPEFLEPLDGFTFFNNHTGMYPTTKGALSFLLTGQPYLNEQPYSDYIDQAYKNSNYYSVLKKEEFDVGIYTNSLFASNKYGRSFVDNLEDSGIAVTSHKSLLTETYKLTAFKYFPHITKKHFWFHNDEFERLRGSASGSQAVFSTRNLDYYNALYNDKLTVIEDKCYRFIHINGMHSPFDLGFDDEKNIVITQNATYDSQLKAVLTILFEYINQLKELNLYDNSLIIITADHGIGAILANPVLLIKDYGAEGKLDISTTPVSHADLQATVMSSLGLNLNNEYGYSILDNSIDLNRERTFLYYLWDDLWDKSYLPNIREYKIKPENNDRASFYATGKIYTPQGILTQETLKYVVGQEILLNKGHTENLNYFQEGLSFPSDNIVWSDGYFARMAMNIDDVDSDLLFCTVNFEEAYNGEQQIIIKSNEKILFDRRLTSRDEAIKFMISKDLIEEGVLLLDFSFPDAISPFSLGLSHDQRLLAFAFSSMMITEVPEILLGEEIFFLKANPAANQYIISGFSKNEDSLTWNNGKNAKMAFAIKENPSDLSIRINVSHIHGAQRFITKVGEEVVFNKVITNLEPIEFVIPAKLVKNQTLILDFEFPDAISPLAIGNGDDSRNLAFAFKSMIIEEIK